MLQETFARFRDNLASITQTVSDFLVPKVQLGVAQDPLLDLKMPAREGLGILFNVNAAASVPSSGIGIAMGSPFSSLAIPPVIHLKTIVDGVASERIISEEMRRLMVADMEQQVQRDGMVTSVPKVAVSNHAQA